MGEHTPKARFCAGSCSASVYENQSADGKTYYSVKLSKSYVEKSTGQRKYTDSFSMSEIPDLVSALEAIVKEFRVRRYDGSDKPQNNTGLKTLAEQGAGFDTFGLE